MKQNKYKHNKRKYKKKIQQKNSHQKNRGFRLMKSLLFPAVIIFYNYCTSPPYRRWGSSRCLSLSTIKPIK